MNFHEILSGPLGRGLAWTLLHFLWQGLLIGAVAAAAGWLFSPSRTRGRYAVAMTGLVLMACCPLVTFAVLQIPAPKNVAVAPSPDLRNGKMQPSAAVPFLEDDVALPAPRPSHLVSMAPPSAHRIVSDAPATPAPVPRPIEPEWRERIARRAAALQSYVVTAWLAGVIALSGRLLMSLLGVRRLARGRLPVSAELASCANRLARRLGLSASPGVFVSKRIREAMLVGLWRPMVLLPAAWIAEMPPDVLEAVIAHELAHMRRLDLWANLVQRLVEMLLFYHPAVWWLSRRASLLREMCADELAVEATGERMTYATVLELLGRQRLKLPAPQLAAGIGGRRMVLLARVRNILGAAPGDERLRWWPAGLLALLVPLGIWLGSIGLCGDLTAKNSGAAEKPKTDGPAAKSSGTAANAHGRGETGEKPKASSKPIVSTVTTKPGEPWPLSLKETLRVALLNSKAMRQIRAIVQLPDSKNNSAPSADRRPALTPDNNRLVVARGNTDIGLIEFEASVCNLVSDVDTAYWDLFLKYRLLETAVQGRDRALRAWQKANEIYLNGPKEGGAAFEAQALEQYYGFRNEAEQAQAQLYDAERRLRFMMGIAASDGRRICPADSPPTAKLSIDWQSALSESLRRSPAIREARFRVKQRELELNAAEKYVVPADQKDVSLAIQKRNDSIANANLTVARERVRLTETEKDVVSQLSFAVIGMDAAYMQTFSSFNRRAAAKRQIEAVEAAYGHGLNGITVNDLLSARERLATAESDYYRSLTNYAKAISQVHLLKGTLLDYHGIELAERPDQHVTADPAKKSTTNPAGMTAATKDFSQITVAGLCRDEQGRPIADAELFLYRVEMLEGTQQQLQTARSDRDGQFRFAPVADLAKEMEVWKRSVPQFAPYWIIGKAIGRATTCKWVRLESATLEEKKASLQGDLATTRAQVDDLEHTLTNLATTMKPDEHARVMGQLTEAKEKLNSLEHQLKIFQTQIDALKVQTHDDPQHLDLKMPEVALLSGTVTDPDGKPVKGALVSTGILPKPVLGLRCEATDARGVFEIRDLPAMDLTVPPKGRGPYATSIFFDVSCRGFADKKVAYSQVPGKVDVSLDLAAVIQGRVVYGKDGGAAAGVRVQIQNIDRSSQHVFGTTDADSEGRYRFGALGPGQYNIWASKDGYTMRAIDSIEAVPGTTKAADDLRLVRGGLIGGHVVDADTGRPFRPVDAAASLWFRPDVAMYGPSRPQSGAACESAPIQEDGSFQIRAAPGSNHVYLRIWDRSQAVPPDALDVDVAEGQTAKIEFKVRRKTGAFKGTSTQKAEVHPTVESSHRTILDPAAVPLGSASRSSDDNSFGRWVVDKSGTIREDGKAIGVWGIDSKPVRAR